MCASVHALSIYLAGPALATLAGRASLFLMRRGADPNLRVVSIVWEWVGWGWGFVCVFDWVLVLTVIL